MSRKGSDSEDDEDYHPPDASPVASEEETDEDLEQEGKPRRKQAKLTTTIADADSTRQSADSSAYNAARADLLWSQFNEKNDASPVKRSRQQASTTTETICSSTTSSNADTPVDGASAETSVPSTSAELSPISRPDEVSSSSSFEQTPCQQELNPGFRSSATKRAPKSGVDGVLSSILKKPKKNILEQSRTDWEDFKRAEGFEDELQQFNRGKQGYIEKINFLNRTDFRQFEIERSTRTSSSKKPWLKPEF